jgi:hypothetical protein
VASAIAACTRQGEPSASRVPAAPLQPPALAEAAAEIPHLTVRVLEVKRTGPDVITVALQLVNTGGPGQAVPLGSAFAADPRDAGTLADMSLWDEAGQRKYYLMRDDAGRPRSSVETADLATGEPRSLWASFPAPPASVTRLTVCLPHVPPMRSVPVS